jgi:hypothetical protein
VQHLIESKGEPYSVKSDLKGCQGGGKFYYVGTNNLLWNTYWNDANEKFHSAPLDWNEYADGNLSLSQDGDVVFFSYKNKLKYYQNGLFKTITLENNGDVLSDVVSSPDGLVVYYKSLVQNRLVCYSRTSIFSHIWTRREYDNPVVGDNFVHQYLFGVVSGILFRGTDNKIYYLNNDGTWFWAICIGAVPNVKSDIVANSDCSKIYYKSIDNKLYYYDSFSWNNTNANIFYANYYGVSQPLEINNIRKDICLSPQENNTQIYYIGEDNRPWVIYSDNGSWYVNPIDNNFIISDDLHVPLLSDNSTLAFKDPQNQIRTISWNPCEVLNPQCGSTVERQQHVRNVPQIDNLHFGIYPNPAQDRIFLKNTAPATLLNCEVIVYNYIGLPVITSIDKQSITPGELISIDISSFCSGTYYVSLSSDSIFKIIPFVKE